MYPTWEPSNHGEKGRIAAKYANIASPTTSQTPPLAVFPPPLDLDALLVGITTLAIVPNEQVHEEAMTLFNASTKIASPPGPVPVNGLYILITEIDEQWVPKKLLDNSDACMQYLHKQLEDGTVKQLFDSTFGQWFLHGKAHVYSSHAMSMFFYSTRVLCLVIHLLVKDIDNDLFELPLQNTKNLGEHNEFLDRIEARSCVSKAMRMCKCMKN